tara:strand:+ start:252 stop:1091 length:840 start_codon:yes stop_codon:yes gene_type:complete
MYTKNNLNRKKILTVISLGAGVQSSTMALMSAKGELPKADCAIFADTGYEPKAIYKYLNYLKPILSLAFPIYIVSKGNIKDDTIKAATGNKFVVAPFFTKNNLTGKKGMTMRQCTNDYKIQPIRKKIRQLCNIGYKKHFPKDKYVEQWIGISTDEISRMKPARDKYILNKHPLIDLNMSRKDCLDWMKKNNFLLPQKSACICCPYRDDLGWINMKKNNPDEFSDAVEFDKKIRKINKDSNVEIFTHKSLKPLDEVEFKNKKEDNQLDLFNNECEGMCGV